MSFSTSVARLRNFCSNLRRDRRLVQVLDRTRKIGARARERNRRRENILPDARVTVARLNSRDFVQRDGTGKALATERATAERSTGSPELTWTHLPHSSGARCLRCYAGVSCFAVIQPGYRAHRRVPIARVSTTLSYVRPRDDWESRLTPLAVTKTIDCRRASHVSGRQAFRKPEETTVQ